MSTQIVIYRLSEAHIFDLRLRNTATELEKTIRMESTTKDGRDRIVTSALEWKQVFPMPIRYYLLDGMHGREVSEEEFMRVQKNHERKIARIKREMYKRSEEVERRMNEGN